MQTQSDRLKNKNAVKKITSVVIIFVCLLLLPFSVSGEIIKKVRLGAFAYPPFYFKENGAVEGIAVDLVEELFGRMNIEVEIQMFPLKRLLYNLENGDTDGVMILIRTPERERYLHYTVPVMTVRGLIWSASDREGGAVEFEKIEDLQPYSIGVTRGYSYGNELDRLLKTMRSVDTANSDILNFKKLMNHRFEIFPGNEIVAKGIFKKHPEFKGKFIHSQKAFIEWVLHMGISKKSRLVPLIPDINRILSELKDQGFIDRTVIRYTE